MKIRFEAPCLHKGDIYAFTPQFENWLEVQIGKRVEESQAYTKQNGKDWTLFFRWDTGKRLKRPRLAGPWVDRKYKEKRWLIELPSFRYTSPDAKAYVPLVGQFLKSVATVLKEKQINAARLQDESEALLKQFVSQPGMLKHDPHPYTFGTRENPYGLKQETAVARPKLQPTSQANFLKRPLPKWKIPKDIQKCVEVEGGIWEDERFDPVLLSVMSGTSFGGRDVPLAWQIEFDPFNPRLAAANGKLAASGIDPDGDGWSEFLESEFARRYPKLAGGFHSDSESSACVVWVESERACLKLIELLRSLIYSNTK